jgi:hypothetical protein
MVEPLLAGAAQPAGRPSAAVDRLVAPVALSASGYALFAMLASGMMLFIAIPYLAAFRRVLKGRGTDGGNTT